MTDSLNRIGRDIKFRARARANGQWKYGSLIIYSDKSVAIVDETDLKTWPCDDETVGQYTGILDKNGVEIYEGDIVSGICSDVPSRVCEGLKQSDLMGKPVKGFIDYSGTYAQFRFTTDEITYLAFPFGILEPEVIGNIYTNPELLKKA